MAVNELITDIRDNFLQQIDIYSNMLDLSARQLHILEQGGGRVDADEINLLLIKRQQLMETIGTLTERNKKIQNQISRDLGIEEFILTKLEKAIDKNQYADLRALIANLGEMLKLISDQDEKSQQLMRRGLKSSARPVIKTGNEQASNAYKQSMQQNKPDK